MAIMDQIPTVQPIAVIGYSFKMPQDALDEAGLWRMMENKVNALTKWPQDRALLAGDGAYFLKEPIATFDAPFFSVTAKEAAAMDPQQRLALEVSYHAFENAGITVDSLAGSLTAVYGASMSNDWARMSSKDPDTTPREGTTGFASSLLANRISWYFDLRGPSIHIDTACSSSLVALHLACQAIHSGDASAALVLGSSLLLTPELSLYLSNMNFMSADSRSYSFDERANGYARGEGIVALVIKPLQPALENGDAIRAIVRATGSNQDGRTPGITQPSAQAQEALIRHTYAKAGLAFDKTRYVEAHGTGTPIGDPLEARAIGKVFGEHRSAADPIFFGSIKANIGHLEGASGLAGIIKSIMMLERGIIPPQALFERLSPSIDSKAYNMEIPTRSMLWPQKGLRRISINSFGFGGANAHAVLDDAFHYLQGCGLQGHDHCLGVSVATNGDTICREHQRSASGPRLLIWSAASEDGIHRTLEAFSQYYLDHIHGDDEKIDRLAYTLAVRRSLMAWRSFAIVDDAYASTLSGSSAFSLPSTKPVRVSAQDVGACFVFTGQGAQYVDMGMALLDYPVFEQSLRRSDECFANLGSTWSLFDEIRCSETINRPECSQPLCTALQIALVELLGSFNIRPAAVVGHSSGEIAAAYASGALSQASACRAAYFRGKLAGELRTTCQTPGTMISVAFGEEEAPLHLAKIKGDALHIACYNSPNNLTISGSVEAIIALKRHLDEEGIFAQILNTGIAYHSPEMQPIAEQYAACLDGLQCEVSASGDQRIPMVSSVTGRFVTPETLATPQYWVQNLVSPVQFTKAMQLLANSTSEKAPSGDAVVTATDIIEIGPHAALRRPVKETAPGLRYNTCLQRSKPPLQSTLELVGTLFSYGYPVSVAAANGQGPGGLPLLVDCPPYPFDRSRQYWNESRISKGFRLREGSPGVLLGRRALDWNQLQPRWRNWLSVEAIPWLGHHTVSGAALCPGAGMLVMVIEAVGQIAQAKSQTISGFLIQDAEFLAPIRVGETSVDATETELYLTRIQGVDGKEPTWFEARIFAHHGDAWTECFRAKAQMQLAHHQSSAAAFEFRREQEASRRWAESRDAACTMELETRAFYDFCNKHGLGYGKTFQLLHDMTWDGGKGSAASISMSPEMLRVADSPVHPAVLDAAFHLVLAQASRGLNPSAATPTLVPQHLAEAWISATPWWQSTGSVRLSSSSGAGTATIRGLADDGSCICVIQGLAMAEVSRPSQPNNASSRTLLYSLEWKPKLSLLGASDLQKVCHGNAGAVSQGDASIVEFLPKMDMVMRNAAKRALRAVSDGHINLAPPHIRRYAASLRGQLVGPLNLSDSAFGVLLQECESRYPQWFLFPTIARALPRILRGDTDPLELMFATGAAEAFYEYLFNNHMRDGRLQSFLELSSHEKPGLRVLEVGAGTGSFTRHILSVLEGLEARTGTAAFSEYVFTDISPAFVDGARNQFHHGLGRMSFQTLDLEVDGDRGDLASFDVILAGSVLHATRDLAKTLGRLRKLLKPGGYLVFQEITVPVSALINISFGSLPGWWLAAEEGRQTTPLVTQQRWNELLLDTGFSGIQLALRDHEEDACHISTVMIAKAVDAVEPSNAPNKARLVVMVDPSSEAQQDLAAGLGHDYETHVMSLADVGAGWTLPSREDVLVCLIEVGASWLVDLSDIDFEKLQILVQETGNMLWVSSCQRRNHLDAPNPESALATGLLRSIRSENNDKHVVSLLIESATPTRLPEFLDQALESCLGRTAEPELEYVVRDDRVMAGRLTRETHLDAQHKARRHPTDRTGSWQSGPPLKLEVGTVGMLESLRFVEDTAYHDDLAPDEVEIEAEAWPLSFRDVLLALGKVASMGLGLECAGTVTRTGSSCPEFQPGDRVVMVALDSIRRYPRAKVHAVIKVPHQTSLNDAVASITPCTTAWQALVNVARLQSNESVLIHSAAGGTGQLAVQVAQMIGAEVFATVGSDDKKDLLIEQFGIPETHIFHSRDVSFAKGIKRITDGYGVDVVLNSLSGDGLRASWECIAPYGRFIEIGKADIGANSGLPMSQFAKNVAFAAVDIVHIEQTSPRLFRQLLAKTMELVSEGHVRSPKPLHIYPLSGVERAFRFMQSGKNTGRIILNRVTDDVVTKHLVDKSNWQFGADASYVIVGGLGGLGRAMIQWMADKGARNLIVPSRSGVSSEAASRLVSTLRRRGICIVTPCCDASSEAELSKMLQQCSETMPPVRGCINSAMHLQDSILSNMTHGQWRQSMQSKVHSSWNLHRLLPRDMDFFILLSSLAGIYGTLAQSNYAAGCTFQDALARARTEAGQGVSVSLDLGWMVDAGIISERAEYRRTRDSSRDMAPVTAADLVTLLEHYCDPALRSAWGRNGDSSQLLVGAVTPSDFAERRETVPPFLMRPFFQSFNVAMQRHGEPGSGPGDDVQQSPGTRFLAAATAEEAVEVVVGSLKARLARALGIASHDDVDSRKTLSDYGVDSLMAVELRNWMWNEFGVDVAVFEIMGRTSIAGVGNMVMTKVEAAAGGQGAAQGDSRLGGSGSREAGTSA